VGFAVSAWSAPQLARTLPAKPITKPNAKSKAASCRITIPSFSRRVLRCTRNTNTGLLYSCQYPNLKPETPNALCRWGTATASASSALLLNGPPATARVGLRRQGGRSSPCWLPSQGECGRWTEGGWYWGESKPWEPVAPLWTPSLRSAGGLSGGAGIVESPLTGVLQSCISNELSTRDPQ
jgi:hypothetical protein